MCVCDFDLSTLFPNQLIDSPQRVSSGFFYFLVTYSYLSLSLSLSLAGWFFLFIGPVLFWVPKWVFRVDSSYDEANEPKKTT